MGVFGHDQPPCGAPLDQHDYTCSTKQCQGHCCQHGQAPLSPHFKPPRYTAGMAGPHIDLKALIREVPDFPQPGVLFRDITPLLGNAEAYRYVIDELTRLVGAIAPDAVVGIESRGFLFGAPVAYNLRVPFVPVRKARAAPRRATTAFAASTT